MSPEQLLGSVDFPEEDVVVADFEAGVGTLTRLGEEHVDTVVIVVEATPKSLEVGARAAALAAEKTVARIETRLRSAVEAGEFRKDISPLGTEAIAWAVMGANVFLGLRFGVWGQADPEEVAGVMNRLLERGLKP